LKVQLRRIIIALVIGLASLGLAWLLYQTPLVKGWENQVNDLLFRRFPTQNNPEIPVIISIDQNSLDHLQKQYKILWPWPRSIYAAAIEYLEHCGAKVIVFDIIFSSPDIDRLNVNAAYSDSVLARALRRSGKVVLAAQMEDSTHQSSNPVIDLFNYTITYKVDKDKIKSYPQATLPLPQFQKAAAYPGAVNFFTDADGTCRRIPLLYQYKNHFIPYMALTAAMIYDNEHELYTTDGGRALAYADRRIPVQKDGFFNIYWYGKGGPKNTFQYYSFAQLLTAYGQWKRGADPFIPPEAFQDKAVFIGATAAGLLDLKTTPFSPLEPYPGVEIYATVFANIIRGDFSAHTPLILWGISSFLLLFLICFLWQNLKVWQSVILSIAFFLIPPIIGVATFTALQTFIPLVTSEIALLSAVLSILVVSYLTEGKEKKMIKKVFNRYLHPAVVENLTKEPEKVEMGGKEIEATVLFSDLQGFTGISELFSPKEIVEFLNQYFEKVEQVIFENNGMLDKYTGDGIMAIFGAPLETPKHAHFACDAILGFKKLSDITIKAKEQSIPLITRVGVNSGRFVVGNIGSSRKTDYTAIGDTVNLSARLEGVNKQYGTHNLISETTYAYIKEDYICRELDFIRVKGREKPLRIYNVISRTNELQKDRQLLLTTHQEALALYREQKYRKARKMFEKLLTIDANDPVAKTFMKRCDQLRKNPELIDEQGIYNITVK